MAERIPTGMPTTQDRTMAMTAISTVRGPRCTIRSTTVSPRQKERPSLPLAMSCSHLPYCTINGELRPRSASIFARSSGLMCVACVPNMTLTGSPGITRSATKITMVTPSNAGMLSSARRRMYLDIRLVPFSNPPESLTRRGLHGFVGLFRQPPDFIAHAFPEVDASCGCPMALHVVPPRHWDDGIGPHNRRDILVQDRDALVNKLFEFCGI